MREKLPPLPPPMVSHFESVVGMDVPVCCDIGIMEKSWDVTLRYFCNVAET